jgi:hypothetical protein
MLAKMSEDTESLRALARRCRSMAKGVSTPGVAQTLHEMAQDYEQKADAAARAEPMPSPEPPKA